MPATTVPAELLYTTSTLIESFKIVPLAPQFLRDKLFPRVSETASDQVAVDFYNGSQKLAPYCSRFSKGTAVPREKTQTSLFSPPFIKPIRNLTADELYYKTAVQAANATGNRDAELMLLDFQELDAMIGRREEWMASQCLFTGKVVCLDGDSGEVTAELVYGTPTKTVPAKLWSDPASDPLADLRGALRLVSSACGASADIVVMGRSAADAFESNPNVQAAYDKLRIARGELAPATVGWGIQSLGTYRGIPLFVYEAEYLNSAGALTPYVPPDNVLVAASSLGGTMAYAGVAQVDAAESGLSVFAGPKSSGRGLRELGGLPEIPALLPTRASSAKLGSVEPARRALNNQLENLIMPNPTTLQSSPGLSDILGAYDTAHWETVTAQLKPASGVLVRGSVLSAVAADGGKLSLTVGTAEASAYGILLDASVDTGVANSTGTVTASVARAGSFRGAALIVGAGTDELALAKRLREIGIFVEGGIAPVALAAEAPPAEEEHANA